MTVATPKVRDLEIEESAETGVLGLAFRGRCHGRTAAMTLEPVLTDAITRAAQAGSTVELRFESLLHLDSATIGTLVRMLAHAKRAGVAIVITYDGRVRWQRLNFAILQGHAQKTGATFRSVG